MENPCRSISLGIKLYTAFEDTGTKRLPVKLNFIQDDESLVDTLVHLEQNQSSEISAIWIPFLQTSEYLPADKPFRSFREYQESPRTLLR